jgi:tetratricopeptide (TPR) repeat protein
MVFVMGDRTEFFIQRAAALYEKGYVSTALINCELILQYNLTSKQRYTVYMMLGLINKSLGNHIKAINYLKKALKIKPNDKEIFDLLDHLHNIKEERKVPIKGTT